MHYLSCPLHTCHSCKLFWHHHSYVQNLRHSWVRSWDIISRQAICILFFLPNMHPSLSSLYALTGSHNPALCRSPRQLSAVSILYSLKLRHSLMTKLASASVLCQLQLHHTIALASTLHSLETRQHFTAPWYWRCSSRLCGLKVTPSMESDGGAFQRWIERPDNTRMERGRT